MVLLQLHQILISFYHIHSFQTHLIASYCQVFHFHYFGPCVIRMFNYLENVGFNWHCRDCYLDFELQISFSCKASSSLIQNYR